MISRAPFWMLLVLGCDTSPPLYTGPRSTLDDTAALAARDACTFKSGDAAGLSVPKNAPLGKEIPLDTIVVLMMENRSFDHLLSNLPAQGQTDVEVATTALSNPDSTGQAVPFHHLDDYCFADTNHEWSGTHLQYGGGKNDGFVKSNEDWSGGGPSGARAMGFYDQREIPFLYGAATTFALADRYFCSVMGPTFVNREYLYAGTSFGYTDNQVLFQPQPNIMESLQAKGVDWRVYSETLPGPAIFLDVYSKYIGENFVPLQYFFDDAAAGKLAPVVFVDPNLRDDGAVRDDFHPPGDVQLGDQFLAKITAAMTSSPQWARSALLITFDEHGGLYDHVPPPKACAPDDAPIMLGSGEQAEDGFARYGFRVPLIVVSPFAKAHYVSHRVYDHTSILRLIEARHEIGALTKRDANADPLYDLFDFGKKAAPAPTLPSVTIDQAKLDDCAAQFPKTDGGIPGLNPDMM
jgi:phospholipase C